MHIGPYTFSNPLVLAPMAGITDRPFRAICRRLGAALTVSEMITSQQNLWDTDKTRRRMDHRNEPAPRSIQIAGADPRQMAEAARMNVDHGAQIIDINMGCPAKKVCNVAAGSSLLKDERRVAAILDAVVAAVDVPVTLKIRTGWSREQRNALNIARIAQSAGIRALAIHGRTRADRFKGEAEYDTIRRVKQTVTIPVLANGDIDTPEKARAVLDYTGADGLLIGRAAQGNPWIFRQIGAFLDNHTVPPSPHPRERRETILEHLRGLYDLYGPGTGARVARKHIAWYFKETEPAFWSRINRVDNADIQYRMVEQALLCSGTTDNTVNPSLAA